MNNDIRNLITLDRFRNGRFKFSQTLSQQENMYKLLFEMGYRKAKLAKKTIYLKRAGGVIEIVHLAEIRQAFYDYLSNGADYSYIPEGVQKGEIINWFYERRAIKENGLFDHYLADTLSGQETHELLLQADFEYKHNFEMAQIHSMFDKFEFTQTIDKLNSYSNKNPNLYYKRIDGNDFLVFNHWNAKHKHNDGFDCWITKYQNESQIGLVKPLEIRKIQSGFYLDRDFPLIEHYLNPSPR